MESFSTERGTAGALKDIVAFSQNLVRAMRGAHGAAVHPFPEIGDDFVHVSEF